MSTSTQNHARRAIIAAGMAIGGIAAAGAVVNTSSAAFTATTQNATNSWVAGTLALTDDDSTSSMFNVSGMVPGETSTKCIAVTYTGTASSVSAIKMYSALNSSTLDLDTHLNVQVEQGTGGTFSSCAGFTPTATLISGETLSSVTGTYTDYATGVGTFVPSASPATISYRFTVTLDPATPNSAQGGTADATFTWEIQSA